MHRATDHNLVNLLKLEKGKLIHGRTTSLSFEGGLQLDPSSVFIQVTIGSLESSLALHYISFHCVIQGMCSKNDSAYPFGSWLFSPPTFHLSLKLATISPPRHFALLARVPSDMTTPFTTEEIRQGKTRALASPFSASFTEVDVTLRLQDFDDDEPYVFPEGNNMSVVLDSLLWV